MKTKLLKLIFGGSYIFRLGFIPVFLWSTLLWASPEVVILDVRTPSEFSSAHLKGAINIDVLNSDFKDQVQKLDKNRTYKLYCRSGNRSGQALQLMRSLGFKNVENHGSLQQAKKSLERACQGKSC